MTASPRFTKANPTSLGLVLDPLLDSPDWGSALSPLRYGSVAGRIRRRPAMSIHASSEQSTTTARRRTGPIGIAALGLLCGAMLSQPARGRAEALRRPRPDPQAPRAGARGNPAGDRSFWRRRGRRGAGLARRRLDHAGHLPQAPDLRRGGRGCLGAAAGRGRAGLRLPECRSPGKDSGVSRPVDLPFEAMRR
jgi:hypothetical protein